MEELYYPCNENKGAFQLLGYRKSDLRLCFRICKMLISHDAAHLKKGSRQLSNIILSQNHVLERNHQKFIRY